MSSDITIRYVSAEDVRPLRRSILRPNLPYESVIFPLDAAEDTRHAGAYLDGHLVGIMTICRQAPPGEENETAWRLQGVAVAPEARRKGCGRALLDVLRDYAANQGGRLVWANGRTTALDFYRALGFHTHGPEYETVTGPHYQVRLEIGEE